MGVEYMGHQRGRAVDEPMATANAPRRIETSQAPFEVLCPVMVTATASLATAVASVAGGALESGRPETAMTGTGPSMQPTDGKVYWYPAGPDNNFELRFHLTDANNETANVALYRVVRTVGMLFAAGMTHPQRYVQWDHQYLGLVVVTAGASVGVAGGPIDATMFFADTISISTDESLSPGLRVIHDVADGIASLVGDFMGAEGLLLVFDLGTAAGVNASGRTF